MTTQTKIRLYYLLVWALAVAWFAWSASVLAGEDCRGNSCNGGGDTNVDITGGEVNVPVDVSTDISGGPVSVEHKSESLGIGLSNSLGDVDIAGCLGSTQWATPLFSKQKLVVNWPCLAEFYLEHGKYNLAAMAICNTEILREFDDEAACEAAHDFAPAHEPLAYLDSIGSEQAIQDDRIDFVQASQMEVMARIDQLEERIERAPAPRPVVRQVAEPAFTAEQKALAWAALTGDEDE